MVRILLKWLFLALVIWGLGTSLKGLEVQSFQAALAAALLLTLFNLVVRPVLIFFTLPMTIFTLGLFIFIINGLLFYWVALIVQGVSVDSFFTSVVASIFISLVSWLLGLSLKKEEGKPRIQIYEKTNRPLKDVTP